MKKLVICSLFFFLVVSGCSSSSDEHQVLQSSSREQYQRLSPAVSSYGELFQRDFPVKPLDREEHDRLYQVYSDPDTSFEKGNMTLGQVRSSMFSAVLDFMKMPVCNIDPVRVEPAIAVHILMDSFGKKASTLFPSGWQQRIMELPEEAFPLYSDVGYSESNGVLFFPIDPGISDQRGDVRGIHLKKPLKCDPERAIGGCKDSLPLTIALPKRRSEAAANPLPDDVEVPCMIKSGTSSSDGCCFCNFSFVWRKGGCAGTAGSCPSVPRCCHDNNKEFWHKAESYCPVSRFGSWFRDDTRIKTLPIR